MAQIAQFAWILPTVTFLKLFIGMMEFYNGEKLQIQWKISLTYLIQMNSKLIFYPVSKP